MLYREPLVFFAARGDGSIMDGAIPLRERHIIVAVLALVLLASAVFAALRRDIRQGFDEVAQVSYVAEMQDKGPAAPLTALRMLDPESYAFTGEANYLNHPPLYYTALAAIGPKLEHHPGAVIWFRIANCLLAALGLALCLTISVPQGRLEFYAYAVPLVAMPVLVALAAAVNNDNAAFAGGALTLAALYRLLQERRRRWLSLALIGVVVAGWAKLTGLLLAGIAAAVVLAFLWRKKDLPRYGAALAICGFLVAALPYLLFILHYGSPAPETAAQYAMLQTGSKMFGWAQAPRLSFSAYAMSFLSDFLLRTLPVFQPGGPGAYAVFVIPAATAVLAVCGTVISLRRMVRGGEGALDVLVIACAAAVALTFAIHIGFSYRRHLATGWMLDAYPRYYLPLAPLVPLACISAARAITRARVRRAVLAALIAAPLIFTLAGI